MKTQRANNQNFDKYGRIVKYPEGEPTSQDKDYKFWSDIADYKINGETEIGICTVYKQDSSLIKAMERHLHTPEILIPIDAPFVLPVLKDGQMDNAAEAFKVEPGEAIIINEAVWHGACLPVGEPISSYFVIFRKGTPIKDVEKKSIESVEVEF